MGKEKLPRLFQGPFGVSYDLPLAPLSTKFGCCQSGNRPTWRAERRTHRPLSASRERSFKLGLSGIAALEVAINFPSLCFFLRIKGKVNFAPRMRQPRDRSQVFVSPTLRVRRYQAACRSFSCKLPKQRIRDDFMAAGSAAWHVEGAAPVLVDSISTAQAPNGWLESRFAREIAMASSRQGQVLVEGAQHEPLTETV